MGLHRAGFEVTGVDINKQPHYPFKFMQGDALEADLEGFDLVWASPPCQKYTALKTMPKAKKHVDLIPATRAKLIGYGGLYVMENVVGAPLINPVMLCGTMFGLGYEGSDLRRHRLFESNELLLTMECRHGMRGQKESGRKRPRTVGVWGNAGGWSQRDGVQQFSTLERSIAMGIDWMNGTELSQAIPPAYSEFLGRQILKALA
jgi:DNA (cytosine-5)-methyltransferase 1